MLKMLCMSLRKIVRESTITIHGTIHSVEKISFVMNSFFYILDEWYGRLIVKFDIANSYYPILHKYKLMHISSSGIQYIIDPQNLKAEQEVVLF